MGAAGTVLELVVLSKLANSREVYCTEAHWGRAHFQIVLAHWGRAQFHIVLLLTSKLYHFQILLLPNCTTAKLYHFQIVPLLALLTLLTIVIFTRGLIQGGWPHPFAS